jgi:hypothetical protein
MKTKLIVCSAILLLLLLVSKCGYSQTWYGNNPTFTSGTYNAGYTGTATITGNVTFTNGGSLSNVDVQPQATLTLQQAVEFYSGSTIESGGTIYAQSDLALDLTNTISGSLYVTGTLTSNNEGEVLNGCAFIQTNNLTVHNDNLFSGTGIIYITGTYNSETGSNYHPLTASNTILVNYAGAWQGFGSAQPTSNTASICSTIQPVTLINVNAVLNNGVLTFNWTSTLESNNSYYEVQGSVDGITWDSVGVLASQWPSGTGSSQKVYSFTYSDVTVVEAGIGLALIIYLTFVALSGWLGTKIVKKLEGAGVVIAIALTLLITSCHKTNSVTTTSKVKYSYFRLLQVDQDGTHTYYQTVFKVN